MGKPDCTKRYVFCIFKCGQPGHSNNNSRMIDNPLIVFLNTQGVLVFTAFILSVEWFVIKKKEAALHALLSVITTFIFISILKELYDVPRPSELPGVEAKAGLTYLSSFPSLHSGIAFALATTVALHQPYLGI